MKISGNIAEQIIAYGLFTWKFQAI